MVTGGARGIGLAIGKWFLAYEYRVALWDIDVQTLERTAAQLADASRVLAVHCDVSKPEQVKAATDKTGEWARVDALVNNAGVAIFKPIGETSFEEWSHVLGTNLNGVFSAPRPSLRSCSSAAAERLSTSRVSPVFVPAR